MFPFFFLLGASRILVIHAYDALTGVLLNQLFFTKRKQKILSPMIDHNYITKDSHIQTHQSINILYRNKTRKIFDNYLTSYPTNLYQRYFVPNPGNHKNYQILRKIHDHFNVLLLQVSEKENKSDIIDEV